MAEDPGGAAGRDSTPDLDELIREKRRRRGLAAINMCPQCAEPLTATYDDQVLDVVELWRQVD